MSEADFIRNLVFDCAKQIQDNDGVLDAEAWSDMADDLRRAADSAEKLSEQQRAIDDAIAAPDGGRS